MKNSLDICFVHKMKKFSFFWLTFCLKRSRGSVTGGPIFANLVSKYPQDFKQNSHEAAWLKAWRFFVRGKMCIGGGGASEAPPPPSAVRVKRDCRKLVQSTTYMYMYMYLK